MNDEKRPNYDVIRADIKFHIHEAAKLMKKLSGSQKEIQVCKVCNGIGHVLGEGLIKEESWIILAH